MSEKPAVYDYPLTFRCALTHKFINSVVIVKLHVMAAVYYKEAVVGTLYHKAHTAVNKSLVAFKAVECRFSVTFAGLLCEAGYKLVFGCGYTQYTVAGSEECVDYNFTRKAGVEICIVVSLLQNLKAV